MSSRFLTFLLILIFTLPVFAKNTILIVGDSLSAGYGLSIESGWVYLFQQKLKHSSCDDVVVNASISGDTSSNGVSRLPELLNKHRPYLTIIELGGNDGLRGLDLTVLKNNLRNMIDQTLKANSKVVLVGVSLPNNYGETYLKGFKNTFIDLNRLYHKKIIFMPDLFAGLAVKEHLQEDGIHPNLKAQPILANHVWNKIKPILTHCHFGEKHENIRAK